MKKILILIFLTLIAIASNSYGLMINADTLKIQLDSLPFPDYRAMLDTTLLPIGSSLASTGILIERNFSYLDLTQNTGLSTDSCTSNKLFTALKYLYDAAFVALDSKYCPDTLFSNALSTKDSIAIPILILDHAYNTFKSNAMLDSLIYKKNGKVYWDSTKATPCDKKRVFFACPFKSKFYSDPISFIINKSDFVLSDRADSITSIFVDFGDGNGYISVPYDTKKTITYYDTVDYTITVKVCTSSDTLFSKSKIHIYALSANYTSDLVWQITLNKRIQTGTLNKTFGDARVWYGCNHSSIQKPFLFVKGYDPQNVFNGQDIYDLISASNYNGFFDNYWVTGFNGDFLPLTCELRRLGYDVIILNFGEGGDWLENNMEVFKQCIRDIWSKSNGSSYITVIGASMGGVIARYGLAEMEHNGETTHCKLFAAFDSPFRGAEVPLGLGEMARFYDDKTGILPTVFTADIIEQEIILDLPATRELLKYYIDPSGAIVAPYSDRSNFLSSESGLPYPSQCRNIALLEGSLNGTGQGFSAGSQLLHGVRTGTIGTVANIWSIPNPSSGQMADLNYWNSWGWITWLFGSGTLYEHLTVSYGSGLISLDNAPGGSFDFVYQAAAAFDTYNLFGINFHCFVPSYSALDLDDGFLNSNILSSNPTTPFSAYYGNTYNSEHIIESPGSTVLQQFLTNELMGYDLFIQNQTLLEKLYEAANSIVAGSNVVPSSHQAPTISGASWQLGPVIVPSGGDVTFQAGNNIQLEDGFSVSSGSTFHAFISPVYECTSEACYTAVSSSKRSAEQGESLFSYQSSITLKINPNPTNSFLNMHLTSDADLPSYALQIFDILGNEMHLPNLNGSTANQMDITRKIDVSSLASGSYILRVTFQTGQVLNKMFTVVK